jgi:hypothetical protein
MLNSTAAGEIDVTETLSLDHIVSQNRSAAFAEIGDELVALDAEKGNCYGLNAVAARIWGLVAEPVSIRELCDLLLKEYAVDRLACEQDVFALLQELRAENLLIVLPPASAAGPMHGEKSSL